MSKFTTIAGLAVVAIGLSAISAGAAVAARQPAKQNVAFYKAAYAAQATQTKPSNAATDAPYGFGSSHPNEAHSPTTRY